MKTQIMICDAKNNTITTEWLDARIDRAEYLEEMDACKLRLAETDYTVIKIAEGAATYEQYAEIIAERRTLRQRIAQLEDLLADLTA